jgi:purine nucleosidase
LPSYRLVPSNGAMHNGQATEKHGKMPKLKVIYDTDPGVDDAMALLLMARHPDIELVGITTSFGNGTIDTTTRNALYLKQRFALVAPVARGASAPVSGVDASSPPTWVHGDNGLGNIDLPEITATEDPRPAHRLIIDLLRANPGEITVIAVGRMTNLALALAEVPDVARLARQIVVMGGAFGRNGHYGNVTPVAEANIWGDPAAADIVFGASWPVAIVPLDVTMQTVMSDDFVNRLAEEAGEDGRFVRDISRFYQNFYNTTQGIVGFPVHDSSAVAYALHPEFYTTETGRIRVVSEGIAFGQTIIAPDSQHYPAGPWDGRPSMTIATGVDVPAVLELYRTTLIGKS